MKYWLISFLIILSLFGCSDLPEMSCDVAGLNVEGEVLDSEYQYVCFQYWIWGSYFIPAYESTLDWSPQPNLFSMPILLKKFWYEFDQFQFMGI